ncbi:retropepsin-like aspartic protease family protein [Pelagibacterium montanilacus]|uniref:retropepsin-like aspartic protease family protein n=1 Tax=Pelagibacterium montanilacus TaxID=2185280 RepID=UPI000F8EAE8F|nr:TIGR02281 family clan AA aspartic protease [Pelagibacterium montanilacus]
MLFVAFAMLIAVGIGLAISADAGTVVGLTQAETARLIPLLLILTLVASAVIGRRHRLGEILSNFTIWIAIGAVLMVGYTYRDELAGVGQRVMGELNPGAAIINEQTGNVRINRGMAGNFRVETAVNGARIPMIFDTGASAVVLTNADARAAGIDTSVLGYSVPVQTANGTGYAAATTLSRLEVGNIARDNVRAFVVQEGALETSLLGMTFLETLTRFSVTRNALEMTD